MHEPNLQQASLMPALRASLQQAVERRFSVQFSRQDFNICQAPNCTDARPAHKVLKLPFYTAEGYFHPGCYAQKQNA